MTGVTVPATAGYYGADEQSTTKWKLAGGSMLQWQSDDIPNTFFMGVTFETDAYKTMVVSGASDSAFNGSYVYSLTALAWKKGTTHTLSKVATVWTLTDGATTYTAANNSLNVPVVGPYTGTGAITATVATTTTVSFAATALSGTWSNLGGSTGTTVYSEYTIGESWSVAEGAVFASLATWFGNTEDSDCFRGYIPVNEDGQPKFANVWKITSGGSAGAFNIERTYGEAGAWCNELINAEIEGLFESRTTAMHFCGAVTAWLKETQNMNKYGNVTWCRLRDLPEPPVEKIVINKRYWQIKIPLEILFLTESVHA
jgi:hypothetical protein